MNEPNNPKASDQLRHSIRGIIDRYARESDMTCYQVIGVLEVVKADMIELLEAGNTASNE